MVLVSSGIPKPTTPKGHTIFLEALPWSWAVRQIHEPFLHYEVEILDSGTPKGAVFSVYVVCASSLRVNRELIGLSLECDKLKHCMDKAGRSVILVVVDADKESAFWLFVQDYVHRVPGKENSRLAAAKNRFSAGTLRPGTDDLPGAVKKNRVFYGLEHLYLDHFHRFFQKFNSRIRQFFNSPEEMELAVKVDHPGTIPNNCLPLRTSAVAQPPQIIPVIPVNHPSTVMMEPVSPIIKSRPAWKKLKT